MKYADVLRAEVAKLEEERDALLTELDGLGDTPTDDDQGGEQRSAEEIEARAKEIQARAVELQEAIADKRARADELDQLEAERDNAPKGPTFMRRTAKTEMGDIRSMSAQQLTDTVVRAAEERDLDPTAARKVVARHREDRQWLENIAARSTDEYERAFQKLLRGQKDFWTPEERAAIAVGTNDMGGFLVPTHLDPTIMLTNDGTGNVIRGIARVVTLSTGNQWNGVTSAGVAAGWGAELSEVTDADPDFAGPGVPVHKAHAFVGASVEAFEDIQGLAGDVAMMFADARDRLEAAAHATGTGNDQPTGIFTALDANTNVEIISTTAAMISIVDLQKVKRNVPVRWRSRGRWLGNPVWFDAIRNLGTSLGNAFSVYLPEPNAETLLGSPLHECEEAPALTSTNANDNQLIFGDFSNYLIVDKAGSAAVEFIPHLFGGTNQLPIGRRGWYMHWRTGADSVNDLAFRLYQDKTG